MSSKKNIALSTLILINIEFNTEDKNYQHHKLLDLTRQKTKGAKALELIIKESLSQSKDGVVTDTAIAAAENKFGKFAVDGSHIIQA